MDSMDDKVDTITENVLLDRRDGDRPPSVPKRELIAIPVASGSHGEGLPYAPEDWPNPGDKWRWRVGYRKASCGYFLDRSLHAPKNCPRFEGNKSYFKSKLSVEQYVRKAFPNMDVNAFFSSFIWKIPSTADDTSQKGTDGGFSISAPAMSLSSVDAITSESVPGPRGCKAGNTSCSSLTKSNDGPLTPKDCDICCSEVGFCRDCCCILCSQIIDTALGGYSFIRCEAAINESFICGHRAHLECALRCYMAGTVRGSIGLDVQYYCRRCDSKTDLFPHVIKLLKVCESIDSRDDAKKVLKLGFCILRRSEQIRAKSLCSSIGLAIHKLKPGVPRGEIWTLEAGSASPIGYMKHNGDEIIMSELLDDTRKDIESECLDKVDPLLQMEPASENDWGFIAKVAAKLDNKIDLTLHELKRSQVLEYQNAEEKLDAQKDVLLNLYQQLVSERPQLASPAASTGGKNKALRSSYLNKVEQIKREEEKLEKMMKVANGFQQTPRSVLAEFFSLTSED